MNFYQRTWNRPVDGLSPRFSPMGGLDFFLVDPKKIQLKGKEWEDARIHWHLLRDGLLSPPGWTPDPRDPRKVSSHSECLWYLRWPERSEFVGEVLM